MLQGVVNYGTATNIRSNSYKIAGKTGTAQVAQAQHGYQTESGISYQASFAGFFPADDPAYSCIVVIHNPQGYIFYGSHVAAPVFKEIADKMFAAQMFMPTSVEHAPVLANLPTFKNAYLNDMKEIYSAFNANFYTVPKTLFAESEGRADTVIFKEKLFTDGRAPDVVGMGLRDAIYVMENAGIRVRFAGRGTVRSQSIQPGSRYMKGSIVYLELS